MDWRDTPVYITNRDRYRGGFRQLVEWLLDTGMVNVNVIDNASTYGPLLTYYQTLCSWGVKVQFNENLGPYAFWQLGLHGMMSGRFIVSDPDVVPIADCPDDLVERMHHAMDTLPASPCKVGPSLRRDNLPDHYMNKRAVVEWEEQFWTRPTPDGTAYDALIDTTFALYHPGSEAWPQVGTHYRLAPPYTFEHRPWYDNSSEPNDERDYYLAHAKLEWTHWSRQ